MLRKVTEWTSIFETNLSAAEWAWRLVTLAVVAGGGTTAGILAKGTVLFQSVGLLGWVSIGLLVSATLALIFLLIKLGYKQSAEAVYMQSLAQPSNKINPLAHSFVDQVIRLPDLYLPRRQLHSNKQFKRCKLVGPGAIAMLGGSYINTGFIESGSIIVLPDNTFLTGVLVLENCTVEDCEFIGITLLTNQMAGLQMKEMGALVVGLSS